MNTSPKTCGTCKYFSHRSTGVKSWGRCMNKKVASAIHIKVEPPDTIKFQTTEDIVEFVQDIRNNTELRFEENDFGCIHWEGQE
jgi:hypothetical protein